MRMRPFIRPGALAWSLSAVPIASNETRVESGDGETGAGSAAVCTDARRSVEGTQQWCYASGNRSADRKQHRYGPESIGRWEVFP